MVTTSSTDADRIRRVQAGDQSAYAELYAEHVAAARRFALSLAASAADADDLVADSFAKVLVAVQQGRGPTTGFLGYLLTTIRNRHIDHARTTRTTPTSDRPWVFEEAVDPVELVAEPVESGKAVGALTSLPERWRQVLWHLEVEGRTVAETADLLGTRPASVSSLVYRAREGLRLAYLEQERGALPAPKDCQWVQVRLGQYLRGGLSTRAAHRVDSHVDDCSDCAAAATRMDEVNRRFAGLFLPVLVIGGTAALATGGPPWSAERPDSVQPGSAQPGSAGSGLSGVPARVARLRRFATSSVMTSAVGGTLVLAVAFAALALRPADDDASPRERPAAESSVPDEPGLPAWALPAGTSAPPRATPEPVAEPVVAPVLATPTPLSPVAPPVPTVPPAAPVPRVTVPPTAPPVQVRPAAPSATPITECDSYGRLELPVTTGVAYAVTTGDGRSGPWTVTATARPGFVLASSVPHSFSGDLGPFSPCPAIAGVTRTTAGSGWDITTTLDAHGSGSYPLTVELRFQDTVYISTMAGSGWSCWATDGSSQLPIDGSGEYQFQPGAQWVRCEATYDGTQPAPLTVRVNLSTSTPTGEVQAYRDGTRTATATF